MSAASMKMVADSTQSDLTVEKKRKKNAQGKKAMETKKAKKSAKVVKNPVKGKKKKVVKKVKKSDKDSDLDLVKDLKNIGFYVKDRKQMLDEMFRAVKGPTLLGLIPEVLRGMPRIELKRRCMEHLEVMSKKRIRRILDGDEPDEISSSGTEESSDIEDPAETRNPTAVEQQQATGSTPPEQPTDTIKDESIAKDTEDVIPDSASQNQDPLADESDGTAGSQRMSPAHSACSAQSAVTSIKSQHSSPRSHSPVQGTAHSSHKSDNNSSDQSDSSDDERSDRRGKGSGPNSTQRPYRRRRDTSSDRSERRTRCDSSYSDSRSSYSSDSSDDYDHHGRRNYDEFYGEKWRNAPPLPLHDVEEKGLVSEDEVKKMEEDMGKRKRWVDGDEEGEIVSETDEEDNEVDKEIVKNADDKIVTGGDENNKNEEVTNIPDESKPEVSGIGDENTMVDVTQNIDVKDPLGADIDVHLQKEEITQCEIPSEERKQETAGTECIPEESPVAISQHDYIRKTATTSTESVPTELSGSKEDATVPDKSADRETLVESNALTQDKVVDSVSDSKRVVTVEMSDDQSSEKITTTDENVQAESPAELNEEVDHVADKRCVVLAKDVTPSKHESSDEADVEAELSIQVSDDDFEEHSGRCTTGTADEEEQEDKRTVEKDNTDETKTSPTEEKEQTASTSADPGLSKNQMEILELEMRARAIKAMLKGAKH
ncbi:uncharacterized protein LOC141899778 [Tubulanus polymorphus]|uniref:uncharacterized protein LOC141899778 n=1 Tax=Tubulanus polymorphus TaxID=672921 RepID=UPI003DA63E27